MKVGIFLRELVATLAFCSRLLLFGMNGYGFCLRCVVVILRRRIADSLIRPLLTDSIGERSHVDSELFGKLRDVIRLSLKRHDASFSRVARLFLFRCPSAIRRLVVSVYVVALQRHVGRSWPHVVDEVSESSAARASSTPLSADLYSSAAVIQIMIYARIFAALNHVAPGAMKRDAIFVPHWLLSTGRVR